MALVTSLSKEKYIKKQREAKVHFLMNKIVSPLLPGLRKIFPQIGRKIPLFQQKLFFTKTSAAFPLLPSKFCGSPPLKVFCIIFDKSISDICDLVFLPPPPPPPPHGGG